MYICMSYIGFVFVMKWLRKICHKRDVFWLYFMFNKVIRDGRPRPPRHQVGWDIPLHFDTNPESLRPFVPEIWPNNVFNLSATYDLDLWPKILKIFVSHGVPIRNMYAKFHNDRLRNGWYITLWNFAKTRTNKHTHKHTNERALGECILCKMDLQTEWFTL